MCLAAAGCFLFASKPAWFPVALNAYATSYDQQFGWTLWITGAIFLAAQLSLAWTVIRSRRKHTPVKSSGHLGLELVWTAATATLFIGLSIVGSQNWAKPPSDAAKKETIEVYAHQFAWSYRYPGPDGKFGKTSIDLISDANENPMGLDPTDPAAHDDRITKTLRIPAGRDILLLLHSRDVIHDFFVRELRTKQDIVPGMEIPFAMRADHIGTYEIACAELCGLGHSQMQSRLIVVAPEEYDRWKQSR